MEDDCASVVVLRSSSIPPASVAGVEDWFPRSRWVQGSLWLGGVAVKLMSLWFSELVARAGQCGLSSFYRAASGGCGGYQLLVSPNKSGCGLDVEVLVVPVRGLQALVRWFRHFGAAPLSSAASSEFSLVSLLFAGGRALW
ncbi:hypothetical protein F2Q68_00019319 [Brassica cretica]|uniref:Uncharacterized protein n=1 Tax=Brassica cretica TaxID=69181 RepID=A0A8S9FNS1_BRACR|nr:hypothetical protein F2Q68_00019319 [Brassica cretica]